MKQIREIIERIVRQEIRNALADSEDIIKEAIKTSLLPELRAAARDAISKVLEDMLKESSEIEETPPLSASIIPQEAPEIQATELVAPSEAETSPDARLDAQTHSQTELVASSEAETPASSGAGRYLYCVVEGGEKMSLGKIGIEDNEVYTIPYKDLSAVVHNCPAEPYKSEDQEIMKNWVMAHQNVTDTAWEKFGAVLPLGFDTIIQGNEDADPEENMKNWLKEDCDNLKGKIEKIKGKAEYGVQVFWEPKVIAQKLTKESPEIKKLDEEMKSKSKGMAYMYKQKLENLLKKEMEEAADRYFKDFYERIKGCVDEIKVEKTKKPEEDKQMLMNFSCLLPKEKSKILGEELEKINNMEGFFVRFTGPWPPYGFV